MSMLTVDLEIECIHGVKQLYQLYKIQFKGLFSRQLTTQTL